MPHKKAARLKILKRHFLSAKSTAGSLTAVLCQHGKPGYQKCHQG